MVKLLGVNQESTFTYEGVSHKMKVNYIYKIAGEVVLTITSEPIQVTIKKGEIKELDLDNDGKNDMSVALLDIVNGMVKLLIKKVIKTVAEPIKTVGDEKEIEREKEEIIIEEEPVFEKEASKERILGLIMPIVIGFMLVTIVYLFFYKKKKSYNVKKR